MLAAKNRLVAADAKLVEEAFEHRLSELPPSETAEAADDDAVPTTHVDIVGAHEPRAKGNGDLDQPDGIDKSLLVIATPRRYRNREHLRYVARQACLVCGRKQSDSHHLRYLQPRTARPAMNSPSRSAAHIIARFIAPATSRLGGRRRASIPSKSPASSGDERGAIIHKSRALAARQKKNDHLPWHRIP
jgi:hypothetical protein